MPSLTVDQRVSYVRQTWDAFCNLHGIAREPSSAEYELARKWALRGVPLATVLQGIRETTGKVRRLGACERAVEESISRWHHAVGGLTELPKPGPLEDVPL